MTRTLLLLLLATPLWFSAQNMDFGPLVEIECSDGSSVMHPDNWSIYQTLDNTWDGPLDSAWCVNVESGSSSTLIIEPGTFDPERPLFAHGYNPEDGFGLIANELYNFRWNTGISDVDFYNSDFCMDGWCSGVKAAISVPVPDDPDNPVKRWYQANFSYDEWWGDVMAVACAPSEYMDGQIVSDIIYMAVFPSGEAQFNVPSCDIYWDRIHLDQDNIEWYRNGNDYNLDYWNMNWIVSYDEADGFPSFAEQSFIDLSPEVNTSTPQVVNLNIGEYDHIIFQPFAFVRGGLVEGSDSIRHNISINNYGSGQCVQAWYEIWIDKDDRYYHEGGPLLFGPEGCFMFRSGGILEVAPGKFLDYGPDGTGMLGLTEDCIVNINAGSTLRINNKVVLWDTEWIDTRQEIVIPIPKEAHLEFGPDARIVDHSSEPMTIKLLMQGGTVDFGNLTPEERSHFELIWEDEVESKLNISPNPTSGPISFPWISNEKEELRITIHTSSGKLVHRSKEVVHIGQHSFDLFHTLEAGSYLVTVQGRKRKETGRVMVIY